MAWQSTVLVPAPTPDQVVEAHRAAVQWAQRVMERGNIVLLDTETTGLGPGAEAVQVGVISMDGEVLLNTYVRPRMKIPGDATDIHGITDAMVAHAPVWRVVHEDLCRVLDGKHVIIYNERFDWPLIERLCKRDNLPLPAVLSVECAMLAYAKYKGEWNERKGDYRWPRLPAYKEAVAHDAIGDCHSTLALLIEMATDGTGEQ